MGFRGRTKPYRESNPLCARCGIERHQNSTRGGYCLDCAPYRRHMELPQ